MTALLVRRKAVLRPSLATLSQAIAWARARDYGGTGDWLDRSGNGHHMVAGAGAAAPTFNSGGWFDFDGGDYFECADHADLNFNGSQSLTFVVVAQKAATPSSIEVVGGKKNTTNASTGGYSLALETTANRLGYRVADATTQVTKNNNGYTYAVPQIPVLVVDRSAQTLHSSIAPGAKGVGSDITAVGSPSNTRPLRLGANGQASPANFFTGRIYGWALWRRVLTDAEIALLPAEFAV